MQLPDDTCERSQGLVPVPPGSSVGLESCCEHPSRCGRTDGLHGTCSVKESSLESTSGLLPKTAAFLSVKSRVPQARSGARFLLKAGVAFHYCPLFTSGSLRGGGQSRAKHKPGFTGWLRAPMHVAMGLPGPPWVRLGPPPELPALPPASERPSPRMERRVRAARAKGPCPSVEKQPPQSGDCGGAGKLPRYEGLAALSRLPLLPCGTAGQRAGFFSSGDRK